jgi:nicotinamidase-related amidase
MAGVNANPPTAPGQVQSRPYAFPYDGPLDPARTALLVIDMQADFLEDRGYFARKGYDPAPLRAAVPAVRRLADAARAAGLLVVQTRQGYRADLADMTPYEVFRRRRAGFAHPPGPGHGDAPLLRGTAGFEILPDLLAPGDVVVDKTACSAFLHTDLDHILRARGVTHLLLCGITTDVCVHSTQREAADRNYQCCLVEDACASGDAFAHRAAIHMTLVEDGVFGTVADVAAAVAALAALAPAAGGR